MRVMGGIFTTILVFVLLIGLGWFFQGNDFFLYKYWAPKYEDARRDVYTHTQSYRQGNTQRLGSLCDQVKAADDNHKSMLNAQIKQEFTDWNVSDVPDYLKSCLTTAQGG